MDESLQEYLKENTEEHELQLMEVNTFEIGYCKEVDVIKLRHKKSQEMFEVVSPTHTLRRAM